MLQSFENHDPLVSPNSFVHETAMVLGAVTLGDCTSIWPGAVLRADYAPIVLGAHSNIQDNACIHTDEGKPCMLGNAVTVGHGAILHACTVGNNVLIGMGAIVLDGAVIGDGAMIAAGAVVAPGTQVPENSVFMGVPARFVRTVTAQEAQTNAQSPAKYWTLAQRYVMDSIPSDM